MKGKDETVETMIITLDTYGTVKMAVDYLNCGNEALVDAAENWAKKMAMKLK